MKLQLKYLRLYGKSLLKLIRGVNLLMVVLTQYIVYAFIVKAKESDIEAWFPSYPFFILCFSTVSVAAAGYIINDYYDIKIDLVNKPGRIVIGRIITRRQALFFHAAFNGLAIFFGLILSWKVALFFVGSGFFLWLYSNSLKRLALWGNLCISLLTAATIWVITLYYKENHTLVLMYSVFAFFISLIREIIKDMEDVKGDAAYGCRTLPIIWGFRKTKVLLIVVLTLFSALLVLQSLAMETVLQFSAFLFLLVPTFYLGYQILKADKQKDYSWLSGFCKWFMVAGVLSLGII